MAVLAPACPTAAFDPEATFAKGTMILGLQVEGGVANNIEGHRTLSDISFLNATPRVSSLLVPPFGSGLLRSALEPRGRGVVPVLPLPEGSDRRGPQGRDAVSSDRLRAAGPVLRGHRGSGGTSVRVKEIDSAFTFVLGAGGGLSRTDTPRTRTGASTPTRG